MESNQFERYKRMIARCTYDGNLDRAINLMLEVIDEQQKCINDLESKLKSTVTKK